MEVLKQFLTNAPIQPQKTQKLNKIKNVVIIPFALVDNFQL